jgi:P-type Cu+ transporter
MPAIRKAVASAGNYSVPETSRLSSTALSGNNFNRRLVTLLAVVFVIVLSVVVVGEWFGLFETLNNLVPFPVGVILGGWLVFRNVVQATLKRQVLSHTLMTLGVLAALAVGQWATAAIVVVFMRVGDYVERFTTESARRAVKELTAITPQTARVERDGVEQNIPVEQVQIGEMVIVRPGEKIPVDGDVLAGQATVGVGADTTFDRVVKMVEEAEAHRADVQRFADKFSAYYLPVVAGLATLTFIISRNPLATAAVLLVACSCSIALATPVAMLASIGASAKRGLLIKGGKYLETLARADVLLVDKTGTLTLGQPEVTDVIPLNGLPTSEILKMVASAERYSEHPLAEAIRVAARAQNLTLTEPNSFEAIPGQGIRATLDGHQVAVGNRRLIQAARALPLAGELEAQGKTLLFVTRNEELVAVIAASDTLRLEVPAALAEARTIGIKHIELLIGDNERTAAALAAKLNVTYRANLLPERKIEVVKDYQTKGHVVVMVGDGVNDAPALA